jgi:hypothetical protein
MDYNYEDFTVDNYRSLIKLAKTRYNFITYEDYQNEGRNILWRHDIDASVHRAADLARIESEEKIKSTYFIHLHSPHYNALESEIAKRIYTIIDLGHEIGVHFDPEYYKLRNEQIDAIEKYIELEKKTLETIFHVKITAFSFHNPDIGNWHTSKHDTIAGLINAYSPYISKKFGYCSDSNGYWRFRSLHEVLTDAKEEKLQVLTHPEWWVPTVMSPRDRITRCIDGRALNQHKEYDRTLAKLGRENIGRK